MSFDSALAIIYENLNNLNEATEVSLNDPPLRAKFKKGDIVIVRDDGRFASYHPKKALPYVNRVGTVVGYKNVPGAYTKFTLEFEDKALLMIHSHFLYGPFRTIEMAKKYENSGTEFNAEDVIGAKEKVETNERLEEQLKHILTQEPYKFTWLETPTIEKVKNIFKYTLAEDLHGNKLTRCNNALTNKLTANPQALRGFSLESKCAYGLTLLVERDILVNSYHDPHYFLDKFKGKVQNLIAERERYKTLSTMYRRFMLKGYTVDNEIFMLFYGEHITQDGNNIILTPKEPATFNYNPVICKDITLFNSLIINGSASAFAGYLSGTSFNSLYRSPLLVKGDLKIVQYGDKTPTIETFDFSEGPEVLGKVTYNGREIMDYDKKRSVSLMKKHTKSEDEDEDITNW
jgi:hypothetical protein